MLINIGSSNDASDITSLLLACHDRIRFFIDLAVRLADTHDANDDEIRGAAERVVRYFSESLPLHVQDEEESVLPRLRGRQALLDRALDGMRDEHRSHEPALESLLKTCRILETSPERLPELRRELADTAALLAGEFKAHLTSEEEIVLPAIRSLLTEEDRLSMLQELRNRRTQS